MKTVYDEKRGRYIPAAAAMFGAGKDLYLRRKRVICDECGADFSLVDSDSAEYCQDCYDRFGLENEHSDEGHSGAFEDCATCNR